MKLKTAALASLLMMASLVRAEEAEQWEWTVAPYLWGSDVVLDLSVQDGDGIGGEAEFSDLLDKLDAAFMGRVEGRRDRWGMYLDTIYIDLSDSKSTSVGPGGPLPAVVDTDASLTLKLWEGGAIYQLSAPDAAVRFDLLAGLRNVDLDVQATVMPPGPMMTPLNIKTGPSETDVMIGGRAYGEFTPRWHWTLRGDYSFGGSEGIYNGQASVGYTFGQSGLFSLDVGYRYLRMDLKGSTPMGEQTEVEIEMSGPLVGFIFKF
ncbi:hypothetical protein EYC98_12945 [Halieaceae bacterium IMCC14734]|uniref:Outer membrane protein beta-barrel domain-containing protein n=1 Tax=Candidatus Litorirhabdus singularis TaxID=2518993 RepID=A0ABT3TK71_9GAMM|nr:hypothetical protein [Candidatus Litorirhabdus singularis]MCX2981767.1 hypothetical protein [Candidatus Litorirhabdus singularis]